MKYAFILVENMANYHLNCKRQHIKNIASEMNSSKSICQAENTE